MAPPRATSARDPGSKRSGASKAEQRAAALPLVLDAAARRRALAGDLAGLAEVLEVAVDHGYGDRQMIAQTAQFLDRLLTAHGAPQG